MSWGPATIMVSCDKCHVSTETIDLTPCAGRSWDARNVQSQIERWGWKTTSDGDICPDCADEEVQEP